MPLRLTPPVMPQRSISATARGTASGPMCMCTSILGRLLYERCGSVSAAPGEEEAAASPAGAGAAAIAAAPGVGVGGVVAAGAFVPAPPVARAVARDRQPAAADSVASAPA